MNHLVIIGGSKGIGKAITKSFLDTHKVTNISRNEPDFSTKVKPFNCLLECKHLKM